MVSTICVNKTESKISSLNTSKSGEKLLQCPIDTICNCHMLTNVVYLLKMRMFTGNIRHHACTMILSVPPNSENENIIFNVPDTTDFFR